MVSNLRACGPPRPDEPVHREPGQGDQERRRQPCRHHRTVPARSAYSGTCDRTMIRGSVISSIAYFSPSRPNPESFAPPYGIWSARNAETSLTMTPPTSSARCACERPVDVVREHARLQAVPRVVHRGERVLERLVRADRHDRAEDLLAADLHLGRHVREQRRLEDRALAGAARQHLGALRDGLLDPLLDPVDLALGRSPGRRRRSGPSGRRPSGSRPASRAAR